MPSDIINAISSKYTFITVENLLHSKIFVQKKPVPNLCFICVHLWQKNVPALQFSGLVYIPAMRQLRNFIWTLTAVVVLALAVYLTFTTARWLNHGSSRFFWNTTSVLYVSFDIFSVYLLLSLYENKIFRWHTHHGQTRNIIPSF